MTQAATHCQVPRAWQPTKQERLRIMLLEMPLTRAELVERTGWAAELVDKVIEHAMRKGLVVPLNMPGRTRRSYAVPGFVPEVCVQASGVQFGHEERQILLREMKAMGQA